ncbi:MAG: hypothetical protein IJY43_05740, partial [Clostridia bacterium]|nr:hypothetical protein [Clostridia bacterium]
ADGVDLRLVIAHVPFTKLHQPPFDIEEEIYTEWARLLREEMKPDAMICGHEHVLDVWKPGGEHDSYGQPCPIVVGAKPGKDYFAGCGYVFYKNETKIVFTDSNGAILFETTF